MSGRDLQFLPYGRQQIDEDDIVAVTAVLRGDWLTTGPAVTRLEQALAARTSAREVIVCSNGTAALHIAAIAAGLGPGQAAIVPSVTFLATANAVRFVGAEVVFADVDPETGLMRPKDLESALSSVPPALKAKAAFPVHLRGLACDMDGLNEVARRSGLDLIEDAAHAIGSASVVGGQMRQIGACAASAMACFSFHPVKTIATGEGGAVATNDQFLAQKLRRARSHGMVQDPSLWTNSALSHAADGPNPWYYEMPEPGFNYRLTDIQCALGLSQMKKLDRFAARRQELAERYDAALVALANPHVRPHHWDRQRHVPAWHLYAARINFDALGVSRGAVMRRLKAAGIGTQVHYIPVHLQPYYRQRYGTLHLPGAENYYARTLSLPLFPAMMEQDVDRVVAALADAVGMRG